MARFSGADRVGCLAHWVHRTNDAIARIVSLDCEPRFDAVDIVLYFAEVDGRTPLFRIKATALMSSLRLLIAAPIIAVISQHLSTPVHGQENTQQTGAGAKKPAASVEISPEARAAVQQGVEHLKAKQYKDAIMAFTAAARQHPTNGQMRHLLGFAYAQDKQLGPAWLQLRQAVKYNPTHEPAVRDFLSMWSIFDQKGVFNVGRSKDQLVKVMGEPDGKLANDKNREVWVYGFMQLHFMQGRLFAIIDPRGIDPATATPIDVMKFDLDDKTRWRPGYSSVNRLESITEYIPKTENVQKWTEMYSVQRFYQMKGKLTPKQMMHNILDRLKDNIPGVSFVTLVDTENDVLFHWRDKGGKDRPAQHEIVRLIAGEQDIHRLAYVRKVAQIPAVEAQAWIDLIRQALLTKATGRETTVESTNQ